MSKAFNHKVIVIAAGILVAIVILLTFWLERDGANGSQVYNYFSFPEISVPETTRMIKETLLKIRL